MKLFSRHLAFALLGATSLAGQAADTGSFVAADGVRLFYRRLGSGHETVVFLHGGPGLSMEDGGYAMDPLARGRTLIMYDQRGGGRSQLVTDTAQLTAAADVRDLEALRVHFGIGRMALIGNSWGSGLALLYAVAHPDRVSRIVFLSPMPPALVPFAIARNQAVESFRTEADIERLRQIRAMGINLPDSELVSLCREETRLFFKPYVVDTTSLDRSPASVCDVPPAALRNSGVTGAAINRSLGRFDLRPQMARLNAPALVIEGAETHVPLAGTREWVKSTPGARLLLIPSSGHAEFIDQPRALTAAIATFLSGSWPAGAQPAS
jgi:proline iminopeptidase